MKSKLKVGEDSIKTLEKEVESLKQERSFLLDRETKV
jgi:hypothetical protein